MLLLRCLCVMVMHGAGDDATRHGHALNDMPADSGVAGSVAVSKTQELQGGVGPTSVGLARNTRRLVEANGSSASGAVTPQQPPQGLKCDRAPHIPCGDLYLFGYRLSRAASLHTCKSLMASLQRHAWCHTALVARFCYHIGPCLRKCPEGEHRL